MGPAAGRDGKNIQGAKFARFLSICVTFGAKVVQVIHPPDLNALNRLISIRLYRLWVVGLTILIHFLIIS